MKTITINKPHFCTRMDIWAPRYKDKSSLGGEYKYLFSKKKVDQASPVIIVTHSKAKHLAGLRRCVVKEEVQNCEVQAVFSKKYNAYFDNYVVPEEMIYNWISAQEQRELDHEIAMHVFDD